MPCNSIVRSSCRGFLLLVVAWFASALPAPAQSADEMARQIDQQLRVAERSMFAGKLDDAQQQFAEARELVAKLESTAPEHKQLKTLQGRRDKLQRELERRQPKATTPPPAKDTPKVAAGKLPAGVSKRLRDFDAQLLRLASYMEGDSVASPDSRRQTALGHVEAARSVLAEIDKSYGKDVPADHPVLVGARARLATAEAEVAAFHQRLLAAAAAPKPEAPASADRDAVESLHQRFFAQLDKVHGNNLVLGLTLADAQQALDLITAIETEVLPTLQPALAALAAKYGTDGTQIDDKLHALGVPVGDRFWYKLEQLILGIGKVGKSRVATAEHLAGSVAEMVAGVDRLVPDLRVKTLEEQKARLSIAQQLDPNNAKVNAGLADIDARIGATAAKVEADIDAASWQGHVAEFPGPGTVEALAAAALDYFQKDSRWGGNDKQKTEVLKVAVRGPWRVAERDAFGRVTCWRLPIHLAITTPALRERGIARVFDLSAVALEGPPDQAPKAPPFDGYWVGDNWMLRLALL